MAAARAEDTIEVGVSGHGGKASDRGRPDSGTHLAIGDIHGCSAALDALIGALAPAPDDVIITLGDYINRGPDSRRVLDRLIDLGRRCRLLPLLGNHEEMPFEALAGSYRLDYFLGIGGDAPGMAGVGQGEGGRGRRGRGSGGRAVGGWGGGDCCCFGHRRKWNTGRAARADVETRYPCPSCR